MSEPALKLATEYVRVAMSNFTMCLSQHVERQISERGLTLTDIANVLRCCRAKWSDKQSASDALFEVIGETTEDEILTLFLRIEPDVRKLTIEEVF